MQTTLRDFIRWIEEVIPPSWQESYDNCGLQAGDPDATIGSVLLTLDVTEGVISEAIATGCNLVLSHHPLIFTPLKRVSTDTSVERCLTLALKNGIAIYSAHTSFDNVPWGVSHIMAEKTGLENIRVLVPSKDTLVKLVTFVPVSHAEEVRNALFGAGAGHIGNYDCCSFSASGEGSFRAGDGARPYAGAVGEIHHEQEVRIETVIPSYLSRSVVSALVRAHPYEEAAYDLIPLINDYHGAGAGAVGTLATPLTGGELLALLRSVFGTPVIRYSGDPARTVRTVAVCGGAGSAFMNDAARAGAEAFITGDIKYHTFASAPENILLADVGHYESEKFSLEILYDLVIKKFPKFALRFSEIKTNPINYF